MVKADVPVVEASNTGQVVVGRAHTAGRMDCTVEDMGCMAHTVPVEDSKGPLELCRQSLH